MFQILKRKTNLSIRKTVDIDVESAALRKTDIEFSEISMAQTIATFLGAQTPKSDILISVINKTGLNPQIINRFAKELSKLTISVNGLHLLGELYEKDGSKKLSRLFFMAGILSGNASDLCWDKLGHNFAKYSDFHSAKKCIDNALRIGGANFYRLWHASSFNFIVGDNEKAMAHLYAAKPLAFSKVEIARIFPLEVLTHFHLADEETIKNLHAQKSHEDTLKFPEWINRRVSIAYSSLLQSKDQLSSSEVDLMSMTEDLLDVTIKDSLIWEYLALLSPENLELSRQYLKSELEKNNPNINVKVLATIEAITPRQSQDIPILLGAYSQSARIPDALRVINEVEFGGTSLFEILDELTKSLKNKRHSLELLKESHRKYPTNREIARLYGMNSHIAGQQGNVVEALQPLFEKQNTCLNDEEIFALGVAFQMTNHPEKAIEALSKVELFSNHFAPAQDLKQKIYYQLKDFPSVIKSCLETLKGNPANINVLRRLSIAYRANSEHKEAFKTAKKMLSVSKPLSQQHMEAIILISTEASLINEQNYIEQAVELINPIELVKGINWNYSLQLIALLSGIGAYDEAYDVALVLYDRNPTSTTILMWISSLKTLTKKSGIELNLCSKETLSKPHGIEILLGEALSETKQGNTSAALEKILALQEHDNNNLYIYKRVAEAYINSGYPKKATVHLKSALKLAPKDSSISQLLDHIKKNAKTSMPALGFENVKFLSITGNPKVTIVVPCYNEARFLSDCLNSVWTQSYPFWECIIIDDNGSDQSARIAQAYCKSDDRFKYYRHKNNKGLAASRNTGLEFARGDYITFLDADDFLSQDSINSRYQVLLKQDNEFIGGVYCQIRPCDEDKFIPIAENTEKRLKGMHVKNFVTSGIEAPFNAHAPLIKTSILRAIDGFTESMKLGAEDWDCWQRMMRNGYSFLPSNWIGGYYRQKRGSMVRALSKFHVAEAEKVYQHAIQSDNNIDTDVYNFKYPVWVYQSIQSFYKRALRFAAMAYMAGDNDGFYEIISRLPGSKRMCDALNFSIKPSVYEGVNRFLSSTDEHIGVVDRKLYKEECASQISDIILAQLEDRHPDTNFEIFYPNLLETESQKKSISKPSKNTFIPSVPAYVKLEESQKHVKDLERIKKLHNIHSGERVFIVGNGPSLNKIDLSKLNNEYSIAVNGIFYKTEQSGYKPTYYVVEDTSVMRENIADIKAYEVEKKFFPTIYTDIHPADESTYFFKMNRGFYEPKSPNYCVPRFSTDFSQRAFCGQSVTFINLQLAFYMGFTEVYLIGMDFSYIIPEKFERRGDIITSTDDDPNHFHPDYFGKGKTWKDPKLDRVLANYNMAKLAYETAGRKIYNATAGGKLELFERKKYDSLF